MKTSVKIFGNGYVSHMKVNKQHVHSFAQYLPVHKYVRTRRCNIHTLKKSPVPATYSVFDIALSAQTIFNVNALTHVAYFPEQFFHMLEMVLCWKMDVILWGIKWEFVLVKNMLARVCPAKWTAEDVWGSGLKIFVRAIIHGVMKTLNVPLY